MELSEGLTGRLLDTHNLLFGDEFSGSMSSRLMTADPGNTYRPWEASPDHQAPDRPPPHTGGLTVFPPTSPSIAMSHYGGGPTAPSAFTDSFHPGTPHHPHHPPHHPMQHPHTMVGGPHKLPPFTAFSPDRSSAVSSPLPSFSTLPSPHARYPLVPAPVQAREIPTVQQQIMDERHIHMFEAPQGSEPPTPAPSSTTTPAQPSPSTQPSAVSTTPRPASTPRPPSTTPTSQHNSQGPHHCPPHYENGIVNHEIARRPANSTNGRRMPTPASQQRANSTMDDAESSVSGTENSGQVSSVSSTAASDGGPTSNNDATSPGGVSLGPPSSEGSFRPPPPQQPPPPQDDPPEKPVKKKRKRCGDCVGCQRKDNCGDCAPCRNDKSHQICKMRRCDKLTEKRVSYSIFLFFNLLKIL